MSDEEIVERFLAGESICSLAENYHELFCIVDGESVYLCTNSHGEGTRYSCVGDYVVDIIRKRLQALTDAQASALARQRARQHKWRESHPGANVQHTLKWQAANKERLNAYRREWRAKKKAAQHGDAT